MARMLTEWAHVIKLVRNSDVLQYGGTLMSCWKYYGTLGFGLPCGKEIWTSFQKVSSSNTNSAKVTFQVAATLYFFQAAAKKSLQVNETC